MKEIKCYALHILQDNDLSKIMNEDTAKIIKKYRSCQTPPPNIMAFMITILFLTPVERNNCYKELTRIGIKCAIEASVAIIDAQYLKNFSRENR